nr:CPBP family intramembrane glutamic endopeptidase [Nocardiopsis mwathae]
MVFAPWASQPPDLGRIPENYALLVVVALSIAGTSLLEEVFFRAMLQTRLEILLGRWPGIVLASLCYGVAGVLAATYPDDLGVAIAMAISVQGVAGLMYGYLWSRYRNIWLNFGLHACITTLALIPLTDALF